MPVKGELIGPFPEGVDHEAYDRLRRRVLWCLQLGLYLLGSRSGDEANLMTLNWAMQVSTEPKHVAVSVEHSAVTHRLVDEGRCFALSLLRREDKALVRKFVKPAEHDQEALTLNGFHYLRRATGAPVPVFAAAFLDCRVRQAVEAGSHTVFVGEVMEAGFLDHDGHVTALEDDTSLDILRMEDTRMSYGG